MFQCKNSFLNYIINSLKVCLLYGINFSRQIFLKGHCGTCAQWDVLLWCGELAGGTVPSQAGRELQRGS